MKKIHPKKEAVISYELLEEVVFTIDVSIRMISPALPALRG